MQLCQMAQSYVPKQEKSLIERLRSTTLEIQDESR